MSVFFGQQANNETCSSAKRGAGSGGACGAGPGWNQHAREIWDAWTDAAEQQTFDNFLHYVQRQALSLPADPHFCKNCAAHFLQPGGLRDYLAALEGAGQLLRAQPAARAALPVLWVSAFRAHVTDTKTEAGKKSADPNSLEWANAWRPLFRFSGKAAERNLANLADAYAHHASAQRWDHPHGGVHLLDWLAKAAASGGPLNR